MAIKQRAGRPLVGVLGGSKSDFPILEKAVSMLNALGIANELLVVSAHRTPDRLFAYAEQAPQRGIQVIIAGAGGAAHLPGMLAAMTLVPVIGVPIPTEHLRGLDSLLSIVQMPRGIPARKTITEYLRANVYLTTSGNFRTPTLRAAIAEVGAERIMFSVDYPFEDTVDAVSWFDTAEIAEPDRQRIGRTNAAALFGLPA